MNDEIVNAIISMSDRDKIQEPNTSLNAIYKFILETNHIISEDDFLESMYHLEREGVIYKRGLNGFYGINNNNKCEATEVRNESEPKDLLDMIKNNMVEDRINDRELISYLKVQIEFYKDELRQKNNIINSLLTMKELNLKVETSRVQNMHNSSTQSYNDSPKYNQHASLAQNLDKSPKSNQQSSNRHNESTLEKSETKIPIIEVIGDSHLNPIKPQGLSNKNNKIIVRNHPGCTSEDLKSFIIPSINKKRDAIIIHCGSNDLTNESNTIENLQTIINNIKKKSAHTKIAVSSIFTRKDIKGLDKKVSQLNLQLRSHKRLESV